METDAFRHAGDSEFGPLTCPACGCLFMGDNAYRGHVKKFHGVKLGKISPKYDDEEGGNEKV